MPAIADPTVLPTREQLLGALLWDADSGVLMWKPRSRAGAAADGIWVESWNTKNAGKPAGTIREGKWRGVRISFQGRMLLAHRIIWFLHYGAWPECGIDHVNGDPSDNRISNLRLASQAENSRNTRRSRNNTSGHKGVSWHKQRQRWRATIMVDYRAKHLGLFDSTDEAALAYRRAAAQLHGAFARFE